MVFLFLSRYHARVHPKTCGCVLQGKLDPKKLQLQLTGFLEKSTGMFMEELWGLLVDAQSSLGGIPSAFLQDKKDEMAQAKVFYCDAVIYGLVDPGGSMYFV